MTLRIYHLSRIPNGLMYDVADGFVVQANSEEEARQLCAPHAGDEKDRTWLEPGRSICAVLGMTMPYVHTPKIILRDFNAG